MCEIMAMRKGSRVESGDEQLKESLGVDIQLVVHRVDQLIEFGSKFASEIHSETD